MTKSFYRFNYFVQRGVEIKKIILLFTAANQLNLLNNKECFRLHVTTHDFEVNPVTH